MMSYQEYAQIVQPNSRSVAMIRAIEGFRMDELARLAESCPWAMVSASAKMSAQDTPLPLALKTLSREEAKILPALLSRAMLDLPIGREMLVNALAFCPGSAVFSFLTSAQGTWGEPFTRQIAAETLRASSSRFSNQSSFGLATTRIVWTPGDLTLLWQGLEDLLAMPNTPDGPPERNQACAHDDWRQMLNSILGPLREPLPHWIQGGIERDVGAACAEGFADWLALGLRLDFIPTKPVEESDRIALRNPMSGAFIGALLMRKECVFHGSDFSGLAEAFTHKLMSMAAEGHSWPHAAEPFMLAIEMGMPLVFKEGLAIAEARELAVDTPLARSGRKQGL